MGAVDLSYFSLFFCLLLLLGPIAIGLTFKLQIIKSSLISVARMMGQLFLMGIFLKYLFQLNNALLNFLWVLMMIVFASYTTIRNSKLQVRSFFLSTFVSIAVSALAVLLYFNAFVVQLGNLFDAKYLIAIGGMLLGNSLRGNIVSLSSFYGQIKQNESHYIFSLTAGASRMEAVTPYMRQSLTLTISPSIASMATMGIVSLPGMMTGQILGGSSPLVSVKYQMAIMIAIFAVNIMGAFLAIVFSMGSAFNEAGMFKSGIIRP